MTNREDVLNDFTMEQEMSHAILRTYLHRYPEFSNDLLDLFNELTMSDLEAIETSLPLETKALNVEALRVQHVEQALFGDGVRKLARELRLPRAFIMGLQADVVHIGSMPAALLKSLATKLNVRIQDVINGMQHAGGQTVAMKSDTKPGTKPAIEFYDYVKLAELSEEEQRALQELLAGDGSN